MATGSASRNSTTSESSLDLAFLNLSTDCETWLTGPDDAQNSNESISTQEWLEGALKNSQYDHTKLHRIMQSQKKQRKRLIHDLPSHPSSLLTSVTEEHDKTSSTSDNSLLAPEMDNDSDGDEFFDASANFEEETSAYNKSTVAGNNQNQGSMQRNSQRITSPRVANTNISNKQNYSTPNVSNVQRISSQASPRRISNSSEPNINKVSPRVSTVQSKQLSTQAINGNIKISPKVSPRRENSIPNDKTSSKPPPAITSKIPAVTSAMSKSGIRPPSFSTNTISRQHHIPTNTNISPQPANVEINRSFDEGSISDTSFLEMSRKIEEQEKKLLEEALQAKKHESRPSSSASTNGEIGKEDSTPASANIPTSKSVDFKGVLRLNAVGRSTSTRIPMYGRTASVASTLHRMPKPRPSVINKALPPSPRETSSNDPWGENCF